MRVKEADCLGVTPGAKGASHEVLMQDFMSLLASFSGKFYGMRRWSQKRKLIKRVESEVERNESI